MINRIESTERNWGWEIAAFFMPIFLFFSTIFLLSAFLFHRQIYLIDEVNLYYLSDLPYHVDFARMMRDSQFSLPHPGFHVVVIAVSWLFGISLETAATGVLAGFVVLLSAIILVILYRAVGDIYGVGVLLGMTGALMLVTAVYAPFFNRTIYIGQGSPNIWHNPTTMAVKPFAFLCVTLFLNLTESTHTRARSKWIVALTAGALLISTFIKPNFVMIFVPAIGLFLLIKHPKNWGLYVKSFLIVLPSLIVLIYQFVGTFLVEADIQAASVIFDTFGVWRIHSPNVFISVLLALAFPLTLTTLRFREARQDSGLMLAWILVVIGILQYGFLAESGARYGHANWSWGYNIALQIVFVYAAIVLLRWWREIEIKSLLKLANLKLALVIVVLSLHLSSGIYYFIRLLKGGNFR